jgi:signal transduction histidine kinase
VKVEGTREDVVVGVVSDAPVVRSRLMAAVAAAGASAVACTEANAIAGAASVDAVVFDVGSTPERFFHVAAALAGDARTRHAPRVLVVSGDTTAERIVSFGAAVVVPRTSEDALLDAAVADAVEQVRRRTQLERRAQKSAADRRAAVEHLAKLRDDTGTLAHDVRVLFGVAMGFASNLRDGIAGPVTEAQRSHATNIVEAATDAAALLERYVIGVRKTVQAAAGTPDDAVDAVQRQPPRRRQTDLGELVRTTVALLGGVAAAKRIRLTTDVARALPPAWCDAMQIKQALVNLLSNALKLTPPGGAVEVAVRLGAPASFRGGTTARRDVELVVSDTGPGIPAEQRERVFERGVRLDRDRETPGTGIGLSVVREVVEQHGGAVHIEETSGGGATFVLTLPCDLRSRAADASRALDATPREGSE